MRGLIEISGVLIFTIENVKRAEHKDLEFYTIYKNSGLMSLTTLDFDNLIHLAQDEILVPGMK